MIISIEVEKSFDENQYTLMVKPLSKLGIERNFQPDIDHVQKLQLMSYLLVRTSKLSH